MLDARRGEESWSAHVLVRTPEGARLAADPWMVGALEDAALAA
jgi:hypothetical protein